MEKVLAGGGKVQRPQKAPWACSEESLSCPLLQADLSGLVLPGFLCPAPSLPPHCHLTVTSGPISAIKRNEIELFVVRRMDLESVTQSEVSQKEENKYHMLTHTYGI